MWRVEKQRTICKGSMFTWTDPIGTVHFCAFQNEGKQFIRKKIFLWNVLRMHRCVFILSSDKDQGKFSLSLSPGGWVGKGRCPVKMTLMYRGIFYISCPPLSASFLNPLLEIVGVASPGRPKNYYWRTLWNEKDVTFSLVAVCLCYTCVDTCLKLNFTMDSFPRVKSSSSNQMCPVLHP